MPLYACRRCKHEAPAPWEGACPNCSGFYRAKQVAGTDDPNDGEATLGSGRVKSKHQYLSTGKKGLDITLGGGLVAGRVVLLGGFPGTGKTRALLSVADYVAKTQGRVIYASGEESTNDVNSTAAHLGLRNDRVTVMGSQCVVERVLERAVKISAFLTIYDSGQKFVSERASGPPATTSQYKAIGEAIKHHCGKTKTCAIVVNQMSGEGELKGGTELEHHCDTILMLEFPRADDAEAPGDSDEGYRVLSVSKNRVGPENITTYWKMSGEGVLEYVPKKVVKLRR